MAPTTPSSGAFPASSRAVSNAGRPFGSEDEGVALANSTPFGLVAYAYTRDIARVMRLAESIETGMLGVNRGLVSDASAPFGGVKSSGLGREGGEAGIEEYLDSVYVAI